MDIIRAVNRYRYLRSGQIQRLLFRENTSKQSCQKRLKYLFKNRYLDRVFPFIQLGLDTKEASADLAYRLDTHGVQYLEEIGEEIAYSTRKRRIAHEQIRHALDLSEFRVCLELALADMPGLELRRFVPDFQQVQGARGRTGLKRFSLYHEIHDPAAGDMSVFYPDALIILEAVKSGARRLYFVEVDRGTEGLQTIRRKIRAYQLFGRNDLFAKFGQFKDFTVLFQTSSERRAKNMAKLMAEMETGLQILVSDVAKVNEKTLLKAPIWRKPNGEAISLIG